MVPGLARRPVWESASVMAEVEEGRAGGCGHFYWGWVIVIFEKHKNLGHDRMAVWVQPYSINLCITRLTVGRPALDSLIYSL